MKQTEFLIIGIVIVALVLLYLFFFKQTPSKTSNLKSDKIRLRVSDVEVVAEVADTNAKRAKGLMFRGSLNENEGMFFVFPNQDYHSFWMFNTKLYLDIIWINENLEIVHIEKNAVPCLKPESVKSFCKIYKPLKPAKYVLEVNAGWMEKHDTKPYEKVTIL